MAKTQHPENVAQTQIDNGNAKAKPIKLGWTTAETEKITRALNALLANYVIHYQKLRNYHWNVKGSDFFDLHEEFESQYNQALKNIDDIAERIRIFGETPISVLKDYLEISEIKETGTNLSSELMVRELLSDYRILLQYLFNCVQVASTESDSGTEEMVKVFISQLEKHHWMMSAFLAK